MLPSNNEKGITIVQDLMTIVVIFFIPLLLFYLFVTPFYLPQQLASAQTSVYSGNTTTHNLLTYENHSLGIQLQYPPNWEKIDKDKNTIRFSPLLKNTTGTLPTFVTIQVIPSQNLALEDLVSLDLIKERQNQTANFRLIESGLTRVADSPAYRAVYHYKIGMNFFSVTQLWTIVGDKTLIIKYTTPLDKYTDYLHILQSMINSLKIQGTRHAGSGETNRLNLIGLRIGSDPYYITMDTNTKKLYMTNYRYNTVSVIDSLNDKVVATIPVDECPDAIDINELTNRIYVANDCSNKVSVIDAASNKVIDTIGVDKNPEDVVVDQKEGGFNSLIFIANYGSNTVSVIDGTTNKVIATMVVGDKPGALAINQVTNRLYVVNSESNRVDVIDYFITKNGRGFRDSLIANITVGSFPDAVYLSPDINILYIANRHSNTLSLINGTTNKVVTTIGVGSAPYSVDGNPTTNRVYVANYGSNTVSVIDGTINKVVNNTVVGNRPYDLHVNPNPNIIYVTNLGSNTVSEINGTTNKILVGVTFNAIPKDGGYIKCNGQYVSNSYVRYDIGSALHCEAIPATNYRFSSWSGSVTSNLDTNEPIADFKLYHYGELTSHFIVPVNISIPPEYFLSLYGIVLGIILPPLVGLYFVRKTRKNLGKYMREIDKVYETSHQDRAESIRNLIKKREEIIKALEKGKISDSHYSILENQISKYEDELSKLR